MPAPCFATPKKDHKYWDGVQAGRVRTTERTFQFHGDKQMIQAMRHPFEVFFGPMLCTPPETCDSFLARFSRIFLVMRPIQVKQ